LELSGDLGGAVAVGVVAVADLKLVLETEQCPWSSDFFR
jgi:hypothetical protein